MKIFSIGLILLCSSLSIKCQSFYQQTSNIYNRDAVPTQQEINVAASRQKLGNKQPSYNQPPSFLPPPFQPNRPVYPQTPNSEFTFPNAQQNFQSNGNIGAPETGYFVEIPKNRHKEEYRGPQVVTGFAWNLFRNSNSQSNFVLSPLSPQILLSYLAWVAEGETRNEMVRGNGFGSPGNIQKLVNQMLKEGANRELQIASAFFVSKEMRLNQDFLSRSVENVDVLNVDFKDQNAASRTISRWAESKTKGGLKINQLNIAPTTKIALTSAIYYKGKFIYTFQKAQPGYFNTPNGPVKVPMMNMKRKFKWGELGNFAQWAAMPYESEDSLIIILPNEGQTIDDVISKMNENTLSGIISSSDSDSSNADVNITLPKFKMESTTNLVEPLQRMGIRTLFTPRAELPYLSDYEAVQVTNAQQQASIDVNEEGTVLIAFTNFNVVALSLQPVIPSVNFTVDRPFLAIIADRKYNVPLVIAKVTNPSL